MNQDFKEFFKSLNARGVEFLVVGGVAYNFYAPPRATKDIDVWIRPTVENATAFLTALAEFGFTHQLDAKELVDKEKVLILGRPPNRIDVLTKPRRYFVGDVLGPTRSVRLRRRIHRVPLARRPRGEQACCRARPRFSLTQRSSVSSRTSCAPGSPTSSLTKWSGRQDSNLRPLDPQSSALTRLRYAPATSRRPEGTRGEGAHNLAASARIATAIGDVRSPGRAFGARSGDRWLETRALPWRKSAREASRYRHSFRLDAHAPRPRGPRALRVQRV